jgi:hypothetical protein
VFSVSDSHIVAHVGEDKLTYVIQSPPPREVLVKIGLDFHNVIGEHEFGFVNRNAHVVEIPSIAYRAFAHSIIVGLASESFILAKLGFEFVYVHRVS